MKAKVKEVWAAKDPAYVTKVCRAFRPRLEAMLEAGGDHLGHRREQKTLLVDVGFPGDSSKELRCYPIVDEQKNTTFADTDVFNFFQIYYRKQGYAISTLNGHRLQQEGRVVQGLTVCGVRESNTFKFPSTFENVMIPDTRDEVAAPSTGSVHKHIRRYGKNFNEKDPGAAVLLLIGRDVQTNTLTPITPHLGGPWSCPRTRDVFETFPDDELEGPSQEDIRFLEKTVRVPKIYELLRNEFIDLFIRASSKLFPMTFPS
eukprot:maker-scaffold63_size435493-snap-gene-0.16 protein:Tk00819 transcript:maker-scaffold63_size435493-snap-gene-0.16-mRNA-1 annotation:"PREDICTED: uncharacterized protein LOC101731929 isoform X1"